MDDHKNFAYAIVAVAPSPATTGTSLTVQAGTGGDFPAVPFNATAWPISTVPRNANAEIVRVTARSGDVLTIARAQEGTTAKAIGVGDQIAATITAKVLDDIEASTTPAGAGGVWFSNTPPSGWAILDGSTLTNAQTLYPALWAAVDPVWKSGSNIILPDCRGRMPVGKGSHADVDTLGDNDGAALASRRPRHAHAHTLTLPNHVHSDTFAFAGTAGTTGNDSPDHTHVLPAGNTPTYQAGAVRTAYSETTAGAVYSTGGASARHTHSFTPAGAITGAVGNPTSLPTLGGAIGQPGLTDTPAFIVVNWIIKLI